MSSSPSHWRRCRHCLLCCVSPPCILWWPRDRHAANPHTTRMRTQPPSCWQLRACGTCQRHLQTCCLEQSTALTCQLVRTLQTLAMKHVTQSGSRNINVKDDDSNQTFKHVFEKHCEWKHWRWQMLWAMTTMWEKWKTNKKTHTKSVSRIEIIVDPLSQQKTSVDKCMWFWIENGYTKKCSRNSISAVIIHKH